MVNVIEGSRFYDSPPPILISVTRGGTFSTLPDVGNELKIEGIVPVCGEMLDKTAVRHVKPSRKDHLRVMKKISLFVVLEI